MHGLPKVPNYPSFPTIHSFSRSKALIFILVSLETGRGWGELVVGGTFILVWLWEEERIKNSLKLSEYLIRSAY